jgi:predicted RNA binding protein YcfA (HicA-like mRNA interferase family)
MAKLPRDLSHRDLVRLLVRDGWSMAREGGRHTILSKGDREVAVPRHDVLKTGTVAAILREAGISRTRLEELLG